jgi:hypothetical protein
MPVEPSLKMVISIYQKFHLKLTSNPWICIRDPAWGSTPDTGSSSFNVLIDQSMTDGLLCYDKRKRDLALETIPDKAIDALHAMEQSMNKLPSLGKIILTSEMSDGTEVQLSTSLGRELWFVIEHAVHHLALIKIGLKALYPDWQLPEHFGMATSTMNHQSKSLVAK